MVIGKVHVTKRFKRYRQFNPGKCAPKSFRIKRVSKKTALVVCCPRGKFKGGRCKTGMKAQSILKKRSR